MTRVTMTLRRAYMLESETQKSRIVFTFETNWDLTMSTTGKVVYEFETKHPNGLIWQPLRSFTDTDGRFWNCETEYERKDLIVLWDRMRKQGDWRKA